MTLNLEVLTCDSVLEGGDKRTPQLRVTCTLVIYLVANIVLQKVTLNNYFKF